MSLGKILWTGLGLLALVATPATVAHASDLLYPKTYNYLINWGRTVGAQSYFKCNYTTKSCERGNAWGGWRVFEQIDDSDRTTVLFHGACLNDIPVPGTLVPDLSPSGSHWACWNFDNGHYNEFANGQMFDGSLTGQDIDALPMSIHAVAKQRYGDAAAVKLSPKDAAGAF